MEVSTIISESYNRTSGDIEGIGSVNFSASSASTSVATSGDDLSTENDDEILTEHHKFMKLHVSQLFDPTKEISSDDKKKFGEFCQTAEGRQAFAKYVDNHRSCSLQVTETTFYKLAHSFALVLFECNEADDFLPAKILMNMSFTYYHYPEGNTFQFKQQIGQPIELESPDMKEFTNHLSEDEEETSAAGSQKTWNSDFSSCSEESESNKQSLWKSANKWLNKEIAIYKQFFKEGPSSSNNQNGKEQSVSCNGSTEEADEKCKDFHYNKQKNIKEIKSNGTKDVHISEKVYLYQALRHQTIWQSLRFWNAAFFDAVNTERQIYTSKQQWNFLTSEEKENTSETLRNVTFAQLGTFIVNMKHLGIGKDTCLQFLRKQGVIGHINKFQYQLLKTQIETPLQASSEQ